jgi:dTDP-4-dehydrorhamnose 3,5-epimerase
VLRGLHFQISKPQAQIITVMRGVIFDVAVDLRPSSPTFGRWAGAQLSEDGARQMYMAPGFAHGFCVVSEYADLHYKVSQTYDHADEGGLSWRDPKLAIAWPVARPVVSDRDDAFPPLQNISRDNLPRI